MLKIVDDESGQTRYIEFPNTPGSWTILQYVYQGGKQGFKLYKALQEPTGSDLDALEDLPWE